MASQTIGGRNAEGDFNQDRLQNTASQYPQYGGSQQAHEGGYQGGYQGQQVTNHNQGSQYGQPGSYQGEQYGVQQQGYQQGQGGYQNQNQQSQFGYQNQQGANHGQPGSQQQQYQQTQGDYQGQQEGYQGQSQTHQQQYSQANGGPAENPEQQDTITKLLVRLEKKFGGERFTNPDNEAKNRAMNQNIVKKLTYAMKLIMQRAPGYAMRYLR